MSLPAATLINILVRAIQHDPDAQVAILDADGNARSISCAELGLMTLDTTGEDGVVIFLTPLGTPCIHDHLGQTENCLASDGTPPPDLVH